MARVKVGKTTAQPGTKAPSRTKAKTKTNRSAGRGASPAVITRASK